MRNPVIFRIFISKLQIEDWENTYGFDSIGNTKDSLNLQASRKQAMPSSWMVVIFTVSPFIKYRSMSEIAMAQVSRCKCLLEAYYINHAIILYLGKGVPREQREADRKGPAVGNSNGTISCLPNTILCTLIDKYLVVVLTSGGSNKTLQSRGA